MNKYKLAFVIIGWIIISIICLSDKAKADHLRIVFDFALKLPLTQEQKDKLIILKANVADLKGDMEVIVSPDGKIEENTTKTHVCKHDTGGSCIEEKDIKDTDFTKINPIPTPTPK